MFSSLRRVIELAQHAGSEIYIHSLYGSDHSPGIGEEWRNVLPSASRAIDFAALLTSDALHRTPFPSSSRASASPNVKFAIGIVANFKNQGVPLLSNSSDRTKLHGPISTLIQIVACQKISCASSNPIPPFGCSTASCSYEDQNEIASDRYNSYIAPSRGRLHGLATT
jgi:hypothetical protein